MGGFIPMRLSVLPASGGSSGVPTGSGAANQVAIWSSASTLSSTSSFTCNLTTGVVTIDKNLVVINSSTNNITFVAPTAAPFIIKSLTGNSNGLRLYSNTATDVASVINGYNANLELGANNTVYATVSGSGGWTLGASGNTVSHVFNTNNAQFVGSTAATTVYLIRSSTTGSLRVGGGTGNDGGEIQLFAGSHATAPNEIRFLNNNTLNGSIDGNGLWAIGTGTSTTHRLNTQLGTNASDTLTLTNGPAGKAGNPAVYIQININGTNRVIPAW